jgi:peptidoglycan/LPS O-acetylase OafA/YrhL
MVTLQVERASAHVVPVGAGNPQRPTLGYIPALDGLRGLAIAAVMVFHANATLLSGGYIGVDMFFVLSGFLITTLLVQEFDSRGGISLKSFYMRRALRLGPALLCLLLVFVSMSVLVYDHAHARSNFIDASIVLLYMTNWASIFNLHSPDLLRHTWSLSIEEQFYLLWPVMLIALLRLAWPRWRLAATVSGLAIVAWLLRLYLTITGHSNVRLYAALDTRADALLIGCATGIVVASHLLSDDTRRRLTQGLKYLAPLSLLALVWVTTAVRFNDRRMYAWGMLVIEVLVAAIILDVVLSKRSLLKSVLSTRIAVWTGSISYGLYLWHYPIYRVLNTFGYRGTHLLVVGGFSAFVVAAASYYIIERPMLKLKHRIGRSRIQGSATTIPAPAS